MIIKEKENEKICQIMRNYMIWYLRISSDNYRFNYYDILIKLSISILREIYQISRLLTHW